ncbi:MAG: hypothetical protein VX970_12595 [Planctomycetota bacterium]|nr:hypothetical protein [Planctomycetota bacterium]
MSLTAFCKGVAGKSFKINRVLTAQPASGRTSSQIEPTTGVPGVPLGGLLLLYSGPMVDRSGSEVMNRANPLSGRTMID